MGNEANILKKAEDFLAVFKKGEEFTKALLKENERLRFRLAEFEESLKMTSDEDRGRLVEERIKSLEEEIVSLKEAFRKVEEENKDFAEKYLEVEVENNNLANLYVASYQLHSTLDFNEVLRIVLEIIINLIGAEKFSVYLLDEKTEELIAVAAEGVDVYALPRARLGEGVLGSVASEGESYFAESASRASEAVFDSPMVCIPLKIKEHIIGLIAIYTLLVQKKGFTNVDHELFNLLAGHAATAIFSARLYTQSERKLTTIQSFLGLLKEKPRK